MNTLAPSFLIGSSSFLQVLRTCMKAWMSSNFSKFATELRPLIEFRIWQTWGELIVNANALIMHSFFLVIQGND